MLARAIVASVMLLATTTVLSGCGGGDCEKYQKEVTDLVLEQSKCGMGDDAQACLCTNFKKILDAQKKILDVCGGTDAQKKLQEDNRKAMEKIIAEQCKSSSEVQA